MRPSGPLPALLLLLQAGCVTALSPERLAANIEVRPRSVELLPGPSLGEVELRAAVDTCNRNRIDIELKNARWVAQLEDLEVGSGSVEGPRTLSAGQCVQLPVTGGLDMTRLGGAALAAWLAGRSLVPSLLLDVVAGAHGVNLRRKFTLSAEGFLSAAVDRPVAPAR